MNALKNFISGIRQRISGAWAGVLKRFPWLKDPLFIHRWDLGHDRVPSNSDRKTVRLRVTEGAVRYAYGADSHMLIEDVYTGIMPFMHQSDAVEKFSARIEPPSKSIERMLAEGISDRGHAWNIADALCDFIRTATHVLFQDGEVLYEIVSERDSAGNIKTIDFELVQPYYFFKIFRTYYQIVPWWVAKASRTKVQITAVPANKILRIRLPKKLGNKRALQRILIRLWRLSKEIIPGFQMTAMQSDQDIGFDFKEFSDTKYLEVAKLTKELGWNQRGSTAGHITEHYSMIRFLRQKKVHAIVRTHILNALNQAINNNYLNLKTEIFVENLFTEDDVRDLEKKLSEPGVTYMDLFNATKL